MVCVVGVDYYETCVMCAGVCEDSAEYVIDFESASDC